MSGYTRQSTADIIPTATVRAAPLNAEYNALRDAFAASGGHKHDGTTGEGDYVPLIADADANNKVQVNTSANTVDFYVEVSSVPVEQISIRDGVIRPITDNDIDLGAAGAEFKDLYIDGIGYIDTLAVHENATVAGTLNVTGVITAPAGVVANITGNLTGNVTGNVTGDLTGDVTSTGTSTFSDLDAVDLSATGTTVITSGDINSGTIDNSVIGNATPAAGTFTTLTANTSLTAATADINGGTLDGVVIGSGISAAATVTDLTATGTSTLSTVDINAGAIDGTTVGASTPDTGAFTTVSTTGQATLASADINGGAIDGTTIGASVPATGAFTTVAASGGVTANVTGNLTGNVTGNVTGDITGDVTGDLTGNVTSTGSSSFNNVTIDGTLNMNAGTTATITNLTSPTNTNDAATKGYVDQEVSALVDSAPGALDTLNELAAALGDDADFSTTVTNSIATKLPKAGGTMSGEIAMGSNKITGVTDPTGAQDASTKAYTDAQRDTRVAKTGDTMSGALTMGDNKITGLATPTAGADATNKTYVDGILGSATVAATSATNAATSETNAATSETNAATSETNAATSATNAAASYDNFDDRYLGAKASAPTVDNDGDALITGALYFNSTSNIMYVYGGAGWQAAGSSVNGTSDRQTYTATAGQTVFAATYDTGYIDVYLNGVKLAPADFTATNGTSITLASGAAVNDIVDLVAYGTFVLADHYTEAQSDARYVQVAGDTMTGHLSFGDNDKALFGAGSDLQIYHTGANSYIRDIGGGDLQIIATDDVYIKGYATNNSMARFNENGAVTLYHNNATKLATTSTGIDVTGTVTADGLTVSGTATASRYNASGSAVQMYGYLESALSSGDGYKTVRSVHEQDGYNYSAQLFWRDDLKLKTTDSGVDVTGTVTADRINASSTDIQMFGNLSSALSTGDGYKTVRSVNEQDGYNYSAQLFHRDALKLKTTDSGVDVTGDIALSGGVYLGGTGAANKLDDYETGTWTPTITRGGSAPSVSYSSRNASYTKIGNMLYAFWDCTASSVSGGSGQFQITGLPFTANTTAGYSVVQIRSHGIVAASVAGDVLKGYVDGTAVYFEYDYTGSGGYGTRSPSVGLNSSGRTTGYIIYKTNS